MSEPNPSAEPGVYQLRIALRDISPLIWRRLLVCSDGTVADLDQTHLHRFVIHGREHGAESLVDSRRVHLADLGLRVQARTGRLLMFPPYWMFQHAGLAPLSSDKYIVSTYMLFDLTGARR